MKTKPRPSISHPTPLRFLGCCLLALLFGPSLASLNAQSANPTPITPPADTLSHGDKDFILTAATASTNEVVLSQLAADRAASSDVKSFAERMIKDHEQANGDLSALAAQKNVDIQKAVIKGQTDGVESLAKKTGADFDKAYAKKMLSAHKDAVALFKKEAGGGQDPDVVALANKYLPTLSDHLDHAMTLEQSVNP